jgi:2-methylcitrate dehydratase PrpD
MNAPSTQSRSDSRWLAQWVSQLAYGDLSPRTKEVVRHSLLDTLGCGVCMHATPWAKALSDWAKPRTGRSDCNGLGRPRRRCASDAALVNGTSIHAFELDDYHQAKLHPGAVVIPAAVAMARAARLDRRAADNGNRRAAK